MHFQASARILRILWTITLAVAAKPSSAQTNQLSHEFVMAPQIIDAVPLTHSPESQIPDSILAWDATMKEFQAKPGETEAHFTFIVTNISTNPVFIDSVSTSCGCTVAKLPATPWILQPGSNGQLQAMMDLTGKTGTLTKAVMIHSDKGEKTLLVRASTGGISRRPTGIPIPFISARERNQQSARSDRQTVFRNDCAKCHAEPGRDKSGEPLYAAVCGICHEAEHRADFVPDLRKIGHEINPDFWRRLVLHGKTDSMMPAFAREEGGPLDLKQVDSLVTFLEERFGKSPKASQATQ